MLAGYLVLLAALAAGVLTALALLLSATWAALLLIVVLLWLFVRYVLMRRTKADAQGAWINRKLHPGLWQMVDEVAGVAESRTPDEIRLGPDMRADVREYSGGFRCLVLGLPLLGGLSVSELRAVTGRELAHVQLVSPWESRLPRVVLRPYQLITKSHTRTRAELAEAVAVRASDEEAAKSALVKLPALAAVWRDFRLASARVSYQYRTPDLVQRFNAYLATPEGTEALAKAGVTEWPEHGGPAWQLLGDPDKSLPYLQRQLFEELGPDREEKTV
jgi:hypothetical protein